MGREGRTMTGRDERLTHDGAQGAVGHHIRKRGFGRRIRKEF